MAKFYITTAIAYVNAPPHIGHALEFIGADVLARYHRYLGDETYFVTGTDEHGLKVYRAAEKEGISPKELTDKYAAQFEKIKEELDVDYDYFIRTTDERHKIASQKIWQAASKNGDIYKKAYKALYCVGCESFKVHSELQDGICPAHNKEPELIEEENYFFKLSKYSDKILDHIHKHSEFIQPKSKQNEIRVFLEQRGAEDISISRPKSKLPWGVEVPEDPEHVMYVWFDALTNYISAIGYGDDQETFNKWWPCDMHVIGKDITRHHCVIWPAMLMAAGVELPKQIFVHGFITSEGKKMSKTLGNVIDPYEVQKTFGIDALRFLLMKIIPFDGDGDLTNELLHETYTTELCNDLGNLVSRVTAMTEKYVDGDKTKLIIKDDLTSQLEKARQGMHKEMEQAKLQHALKEIWQAVRAMNAYIEDKAPWKQEEQGKQETLGTLLEGIRQVSYMIRPFMPRVSDAILEQLGERFELEEFKQPNKTLSKEGRVKKGEILFPRIES